MTITIGTQIKLLHPDVDRDEHDHERRHAVGDIGSVCRIEERRYYVVMPNGGELIFHDADLEHVEVLR